MSRSHKKRPFTGWTGANSEKEWKRLANRALRKRSAEVLNRWDPEDLVMPLEEEVSEVYSWAKDGKFRFDPAKYPEFMRK